MTDKLLPMPKYTFFYDFMSIICHCLMPSFFLLKFMLLYATCLVKAPYQLHGQKKTGVFILFAKGRKVFLQLQGLVTL